MGVFNFLHMFLFLFFKSLLQVLTATVRQGPGEGGAVLEGWKKERRGIEAAVRGRKKNVLHYVALANATHGSICQKAWAELDWSAHLQRCRWPEDDKHLWCGVGGGDNSINNNNDNNKTNCRASSRRRAAAICWWEAVRVHVTLTEAGTLSLQASACTVHRHHNKPATLTVMQSKAVCANISPQI